MYVLCVRACVRICIYIYTHTSDIQLYAWIYIAARKRNSTIELAKSTKGRSCVPFPLVPFKFQHAFFIIALFRSRMI
jgi:hypothetical protein